MEKLIGGLEPALQKLSEIFCVSVDAIRESGMQYILMYGKYHYINMLVCNLLLSATISVLIVFMIWAIVDKTPYVIKLKHIVAMFVACMAICFSLLSLSYWVYPEMYSINAVMRLLQSN